MYYSLAEVTKSTVTKVRTSPYPIHHDILEHSKMAGGSHYPQSKNFIK